MNRCTRSIRERAIAAEMSNTLVIFATILYPILSHWELSLRITGFRFEQMDLERQE
jgi:hypothetical protein